MMKTQFVLGLPRELRNRVLGPGETMPASFEDLVARSLQAELYFQRDVGQLLPAFGEAGGEAAL